MPGNGTTASTVRRRPYGAMRELSAQVRRQWQRVTLGTPRRLERTPGCSSGWKIWSFGKARFRQIGSDEGVHQEMSLVRMTQARSAGPGACPAGRVWAPASGTGETGRW